MAVISNAHLQTMLDKLARFIAEANGDALVSSLTTYALTTPNGGPVVANADVWNALDVLVAAFADNDQLADLLPATHQINQAQPSFNASWASTVVSILNALDFHLALRSGVAGVANPNALDKYLSSLNASTPTVRAHGELLIGRALSPSNVYTPVVATVGSIAVTGAASGTYTHGTALSSIYGAGQVMLRNTKAEASANTAISATCVKGDGTTATVTFTAGGAGNNLLTAGSDTSKIYRDVTGITVTGNGVNGDTYSVVIVPDNHIDVA